MAEPAMRASVLVLTAATKARIWVLVPILRLALVICFVLSFLLFMDFVMTMIFAAAAKVFVKKPKSMYKWEAMEEDLESGGNNFPMVLVQIPMYNEKEVYKISIGAACRLAWPPDRLLIQVLDDSTDLLIKEMVENECARWANDGVNIKYEHREERIGYKAGNLRQGLNRDYVRGCEYVAIFDADFRPEPDFLCHAVPFLVHNPDLALVQARWSFVNAKECFLTSMQQISMDYHFAVEHEGASSSISFFNFNGSGGVWRIAAMEDAGGWSDPTTVEDMDLSVRAGLKGWKFVFLNDLHVECELPSTFEAYRSQQHRWFCGPANLFQRMLSKIVSNKEVSFWRKFYMVCNFFFIRCVVRICFNFLFFCIILPLLSFAPEIEFSRGSATLGTFVVAAIMVLFSNPRLLTLVVPWVFFETVMSFHRTKAIVIGLLGTKSANEWIVTTKFGDSSKGKLDQEGSTRERILMQEIGISVFLFLTGIYGMFYGKDLYFLYLFPQAMFFLIAGLGFFDWKLN